MKLWLKTVLIIGISLFVLITLLSLLLSVLFLNRFIDYEQQETEQNATQAATTFWNKSAAIDQYANSWAFWDAMYEYIDSPSSDFIDTEVEQGLKPGSIGNNADVKTVQAMLFIDADGTIVWGFYYDPQQQRIVEPPPALRVQLTPDHPLLQHDDLVHGNIGILMLPDAALLVAARPIVTSQGHGPARGTVLAGRFLDETLVADIEHTIQLPVNLYALSATDLPQDVQAAAQQLVNQSSPGSKPLALPINQQTIAGYALLPNAKGEAAIILRVEKPRTIYQQGVTGVLYLIGALCIVGLVAGVGMSGLLHTLVVRRLAHLDRNVQRIRATNDLSQRVSVEGQDEVSSLSRSINGMLVSLEELVASSAAAQAAAEEASHLKTRFIANMSHELRTPLNSIINFTYIIKSGMRGPVTSEQVEYLDRVHASGEHLLALINDILDLSRIEAGKMDLYTEPLSLRDLVKSSLSTTIGLTKDKPIELHYEIADNLPVIAADKTRIRQVLLNLLSNAAKFTDQGHITVRVWQKGNEIITSITDTGIGIPADKFGTIFEEFRQANEGSDRSYQGTGLGLPICKRLIAMHGGRIWLESAVGVGSTFFFSLPVPPGSNPHPAHTPAHVASDHCGPHVLVIDDDPAAIEIVQTYLRQAGYAVTGVTDSRKALAEIQSLQPAVIILDILMPYKDGWELLVSLKADAELRKIPVICYTIVDEKPLGISLGADAYLIKPVEEGILRHTVQELVDHTAHILVVDTDPSVIDMIEHCLGENGYQVQTTADRRAALQIIATRQPDLVIVDLMRPEVDGFTLLQQFDRDASLRRIPMIVLQATNVTKEEQVYLHNRLLHLLHKEELTPEHILTQVQRALY